MSNRESYNIAARSTLIFGSVQFINVLSTIIRGKILAIYLGQFGMGIASILTNTLALFKTFSNLGLNFSGVREIALIEGKEKQSVSKLSYVLLLCFIIISLFTSLILFIFSDEVSFYSFKSYEYSLHYKYLTIIIIANAINIWYQTIFQGIRAINKIAKSSIISSLISVLFTLPVYHLYGIDGIVPSLILTSLLTLLISIYYSNDIDELITIVNFDVIIIKSKQLISLGFTKMITSLMGNLSSLAVLLIIRHYGSLEEVGLYEIGMKISYQYVGLIFAAITIDYFPRISSISNDIKKVNEVANHQTELTLLIVIPVLVILNLFTPVIIKLFFSKEFLEIADFIRYCTIGVFLLAAKQALDIIPFAKGDKKLFFYYIMYGSISLIFFSFFGFRYNGLDGIGIGFIIHCLLSVIVISLILIKLYNFSFSINFIKYFVVGFIFISCTLILVLNGTKIIIIVLGSILIISSMLYSLTQINKLIDIKEFISSFQ